MIRPTRTVRTSVAIVAAVATLLTAASPAMAGWHSASAPGVPPAGGFHATADPGATTPNDANDPGDATPAGATVTDVAALPFSTTRNLAFGSASPDWDRDFYRVQLVAGRTYRITAMSTDAGYGEGDPMIDVGESVDVTGTDPAQWYSLIELGNARSDTRSSDVRITARVTGPHYVWVSEDMYSFLAGGGGSYRLTITDEGVVAPGSAERVDGTAGYGASDRYSVAAELAEKAAGGAQPRTVIIASGRDAAAADAMTAGSLAGLYDAPILLVRGGYYAGHYYDSSPAWSTRLPEATARYLQNLKAATGAVPIDFIIAGGPASVPESIKPVILAAAPKGSRFITRFSGADRYAVAAAIAAHVRSKTATATAVFVTSGQVATYFYDTLAASALAARSKHPILLSKATAVPPATLTEARRYGRKILIGTDRALQPAVFSALGVSRETTAAGDWIGYVESEWNGYDRNYMARLIAEYGEDHGMASGTTIGLANKLMDALAGGAALGRMDGSLVYTDADMMDLELTEGWIIGHRAAAAPRVIAIGGIASIDPAVVDRARFLVGAPSSP